MGLEYEGNSEMRERSHQGKAGFILGNLDLVQVRDNCVLLFFQMSELYSLAPVLE